MEQWVCEEELHHIARAKAEAVKKASIDVGARAQELYLQFLRTESAQEQQAEDRIKMEVGEDVEGEEGEGGQEVAGGEGRSAVSGHVPQVEACWAMCYQVALRENAKAQVRPLAPSRNSLIHATHTQRPTPYTLHPTPYTLHPTPYTQNLPTQTPNPKPKTPNPEPEAPAIGSRKG